MSERARGWGGGGGIETSLSDRRERGRLSRNRASQAASIISGAHSHLRRSHSVTCPTHPNRRRLSSISCRYFPCQLAFGGERVSASPPFFLLRPPTAFNYVRSPSSDSHRACGSQVYYLTSPAVSLRRLTHPSLNSAGPRPLLALRPAARLSPHQRCAGPASRSRGARDSPRMSDPGILCVCRPRERSVLFSLTHAALT